MNRISRSVTRIERWNQPLDPGMSAAIVEEILGMDPFAAMDESRFSSQIPLLGILANDCRIVEFEPGDLLMRQGDYGGSVFLVLEGQVNATLQKLPAELLGRQIPRKKKWLEVLKQAWNGSAPPERRELHGPVTTQANGRQVGHEGQTFVQDIPQVFEGLTSRAIHPGQLFGEVSALTRSPRTATVLARTSGRLLEMRWQGFRDLMDRAPELRESINRAYREHSLFSHLAETTILQHLTPSELQAVAAATEFHSFGKLQWTGEFRSMIQADVAERILREPVIVQQGDYVNGLILIQSGFARVTRREGVGEQTIEYIGKGRHFGLREIAHNFRTKESRPWNLTLRATGYTDTLMIPTPIVEQFVLPRLPPELAPALFQTKERTPIGSASSRRAEQRSNGLSTKLLENLVEHRLVNGTQAMVIDLNRCTRCDDCVRACATAHDNNPRFVRQGIVFDNLMFASACMQCVDPVCMIGCPTGAIARDEATGVITINEQTCIGCKTCANSCPYNNIQMVAVSDQRGVALIDQTTQLPILQATKCDLCIDQRSGPACQKACPHDALIRIDLSTPVELNEWMNG
ncbi:MAG: cyclic nucleotide-binding domain-containing protein [Pirellulaceae bacterium]